MNKNGLAVIVANDMITAYGLGIDATWDGILSKKSAIHEINRFKTEKFQSSNAATIQNINYNNDKSLVMQMLSPLFENTLSLIPKDANLILATTTGEIDYLEKYILTNKGNPEESRLDSLLTKIKNMLGLKKYGMIVSAACASSITAIAEASTMIQNGKNDCVLVVGCDCVSEFVFSGFSSLMALDKNIARPFDKNRTGLSLGEAAGFILLMSKERALKENRKILAAITGWGLSNDANHMTGPSRNGSGLAIAINIAIELANVTTEDIGFISAHGTGTIYNDSMEMKAFKSVFTKKDIPIYSIKGGTGHTMGASGLVETIIAVKALHEKTVLNTINLDCADDEAIGWVSKDIKSHDSTSAITVNAGFGGINAALVIKI